MSNYLRYYTETSVMVFITIVTYRRRKILIPSIKLLKKSFKQASTKYNFKIIAIVVLQDHCHFIIQPNIPQEIPSIIKNVKTYFSSNIPLKYRCGNLSESAQKRKENGIWQRRYYDHIIRNEQDLYKHLDYIHYNPMKHYNISPKDWEFSSFKNFVKVKYYAIDWCNFENKNKIDKMELE